MGPFHLYRLGIVWCAIFTLSMQVFVFCTFSSLKCCNKLIGVVVFHVPMQHWVNLHRRIYPSLCKFFPLIVSFLTPINKEYDGIWYLVCSLYMNSNDHSKVRIPFLYFIFMMLKMWPDPLMYIFFFLAILWHAKNKNQLKYDYIASLLLSL